MIDKKLLKKMQQENRKNLIEQKAQHKKALVKYKKLIKEAVEKDLMIKDSHNGVYWQPADFECVVAADFRIFLPEQLSLISYADVVDRLCEEADRTQRKVVALEACYRAKGHKTKEENNVKKD